MQLTADQLIEMLEHDQGNRYVSFSLRRDPGSFGGNNNSPYLNSFFVQDTPDPEEEE